MNTTRLLSAMGLCLLLATMPLARVKAQDGNRSAAVERMVLFEEFTGEWCSLCPAGTIEMENALHAYAGRVVPVVYHDNDPLEIPELNTMLGSIPIDPLYPGGTFDRVPFGIRNPKHKMSVDRVEFLTTLGAAAARPAHTSIEASVTIDPAARLLTVSPRIEFFAADTGDFRVQCVVTESGIRRDNVQRNAYDKDSTSYPTLFGAGDPLRSYRHNHVARALLGGATGRSGVIPALPLAGGVYQTTFTYTVPQQYALDRIGVVVFASHFTAGSLTGNEVLNARGYLASVITSLPSHASAGDDGITLHPNPSDGMVYVRFSSARPHTPTVELFDMMGRRMNVPQYRHSDGILMVDLHTVPSGVYMLQCYDTGRLSTRLVCRR
ncbi:MAG: Omp28-related outer membrane protein [Ignavibacteriae bacterium]|nr:Omp28-related outer membrane protein [Ignavibacteriota bacterium]